MELRKINKEDAKAKWQYTTALPEDEIYLRVNKDNIASQKVMLKNGGKIVGEDEGHFFVRIPKNIQKDREQSV